MSQAKSLPLDGGGVSQRVGNRGPRSFFETHKARDVGDVITIKLIENVRSIKRANIDLSTGTDSDTDITYRNSNTATSTLTPEINDIANSIQSYQLPIRYGRDRDRSIDIDNQETFTTLVSSLVTEVDPESGNLVVEGSRQILMEGQTKNLYIKGVINPKDIDSNNEIPSYKLANAQIQIIGSGELTKERDGGLIHGIMRKLF